jgi:L-lactate dehydrogenase
MRPTRIVVIGAGAVGTTTAYTLLLRNRANELVLIDVNADKAEGEAIDMNHGAPFLGGAKVWAGTYEDCRDADIIIVTAGAAQKPGEPRTELLQRNAAIFDRILGELTRCGAGGILLVATNPVDIMSLYSLRKTGWPAGRVIGSGTLLDSARFRYLIGEELRLDPRSVHAHIVGEHGDSEVPVWSLANVAGMELDLSEEAKERIFAGTRDAAYRIISAKGATYYAIALALDRICAAILQDEGAVLNVSALLDEYQGISGVYLGVPCIVDRSGVRQVLPLKLTEQEAGQLRASADKLRALAATLGV